jgi:hypothetical protein
MRDSASKKKAKRLEEPFTAGERCAKRLARQSRARRGARDNRDLTLGEQVLRNPLIRDLSIQDLNPDKPSDLQSVLGLREFYKLLPDVDLKECYFEGAWQFRKDEFVLANWREMTVKEMKEKVMMAHPFIGCRRVYPPGKVDVKSLRTKEEIVRAFWTLTYVPKRVYQTAVGGAHVLQLVKTGDFRYPNTFIGCLWYACRAGLEASVIRGLLAENLRLLSNTATIEYAARFAAGGGHTDVIDLLASEFGAPIGVDHLAYAAHCGRHAMIDHLVEEYGLDLDVRAEDPDVLASEGDGTALHWAAREGRIHTVKHLIQKYNVDILKRNRDGKTALDKAEEKGRTECAAVLRALMSTRPPPS